MADVFDGKPDARQSASTDLAVSRFRPVYRALTAAFCRDGLTLDLAAR